MTFVEQFKNGFYDIDILCQNCSSIIWVKIPKGMKTKVFFDDKENQICSKCGCYHGRFE